jgi:hypothetical protein
MLHPRARRAAPAAVPARFVDFGSDGRIGAKWNAATRTIAYGRPQPDGHYHAFIADSDGGNERRIAAPAWREDRHQFPAAWHPAGELLAMLVEQNEHERSSVDAIPGYGAYTDYWIVRRDGGTAWKIYALPDGYDHAITHAAFSPDGTKFVWTERVRAPRFWDLNLFAGAYVFKVADFVLEPEPHLENVAASCRATSSRAAKSNRSRATTGRSRSTARSSRRTCSRRASTRWTSRAARSRS